MNKRVILAIVISIGILLVFQSLQQPVQEQPAPGKTEQQIEKVTVDKKETSKEKEPEPEKKVEIKETKSVNLISDSIHARISSIDSGIKKLLIRDNNGEMVNLMRKKGSPFQISFGLNTQKQWRIEKRRNGDVVAVNSNNGIRIERVFTIGNDNLVEVKNKVKNNSSSDKIINIEQAWTEGLGTTEELEQGNAAENRVFAKLDEKVENDMVNGVYENEIEWAGILNRYFIMAFMGEKQNVESLEVKGVPEEGRGCACARARGAGGCAGCDQGAENYPSIFLKRNIQIPAGQEYVFTQKIYAGLKEYKKLKSLNKDMSEVLSFGIFGFLSRLFLNLLTWFESFIGNYGVAIILLTCVLQVVIFPLTSKSYKSMSKMKDIQPKMNKIRTKFKDDPQRMNQEMMHLYKKYKINPLSGCLPLLLQMPIFISLFTMLRSAAELRFAPFLWINDLAKADVLFETIPLIKEIPFIGGAGPLPFLMGGAMFLQQKFTGGGGEGPQKSMTYMMPVVFTFLFMRFPAGLVLYWLSNSILTLIVQYGISKNKEK